MFKRIFIISFLSSASIIHAAEMDLPQALDAAFQNSPKIQQSKSAYEESSWKKVEAFSTYLPSLTGGITYLTNYKYMLTDFPLGGSVLTVPQILPTTNYSLQLRYSLFDGFASTNRFQAASAFATASEKEYEWTKFAVSREVILQFYKTLASRMLNAVAEQNLKTLEDHLKDVQLFKKAGVSTNFDVLRVEVQVSEARSEVLNAQDSAEITKNQLATMLGQEDPVTAKGVLPVLRPNLISRLKTTFAERPDLLSLGDKVQALDSLEAANAKHWIPHIGFFGDYQYYNNHNKNFVDNNAFRNAYQVGLNLTWNIFDGLASIAKSHESVEQRFQAEKAIQIARLKAQQDIDFWKRKYLYHCTVYQSRIDDVKKSEESVRLARAGRRVGARTNTDLLDAEGELYRAQADAVNAQIGSIEALINLELATGQELMQFD